MSCDDEKLNKFRAVWIADFVCTHTTVAENIAKLLMSMFPEADKACKDASRVFFGGKGIIYENSYGYLARLDMLNLINAVHNYIEDTYTKHRLEKMRKISEQTKICLNGGLLDIKVRAIPKGKEKELITNMLLLENSREYIEYAIDLKQKDYSRLLDDNVLEDENVIYILVRKVDYSLNKWYVIRMNYFNTLEKINKKEQQNQRIFKIKSNFEYSIQKEQQRGISKENIEERCLLCKELFEDKYLCFEELFGICTNFINIEGGLALFKDNIANSKHNIGRSTNWQIHSEIINKQALAPTRCDNFCKYSLECKHGKNIIQTVKTKRNTVVVLKEPTFLTLSEGTEKLKEIVKGVFENE